jgi:hypothetical protein
MAPPQVRMAMNNQAAAAALTTQQLVSTKVFNK